MITERMIRNWLLENGVKKHSKEAVKEIEKQGREKLQELCKVSALITKATGRKTTKLPDVQAASRII